MSYKNTIRIVRSKRKSLSLEVTGNARIVVRAPNLLSKVIISNFIDKNILWVNKKYNEALIKLQSIPIRNYSKGSNLQYLGVSYMLGEDNVTKLTFSDTFIFPVKNKGNRKRLLEEWYKKRARYVFSKRLQKYAKEMNVQPNNLRITSANKRFGSCGSKGNINITWRLIMAPIFIIDYVIVHELAHLEQMNHSKKFWYKVDKHFKEYVYAKKWLTKYEYLLTT